MLKTIINSYRANRQWIAAHALMADLKRDFALLAIRKAIELEPNSKILPKYLEYQSEIELSIGEKDRAFESLTAALNIIENYHYEFTTEQGRLLKNRIRQSIEKLQKAAT
jgi:tetratricopeptide (TPR) repeat protein